MTFDFDDFDVRERFYLVEEKSKRLQLLLETLPVRDQEFFRVTCSQAFIYHDSALDGMVISDEEIKSVFNSTPGGYYRKSRVFQEIKNHRNLLDKMLGQSALHKARNTAYSAAIVSYDSIIEQHANLYEAITKTTPGQLRQNMPVHTVYFHDFIEPELIEENLLNLCLKTEKSDFRAQHPINQAVIFHNEFMRIFPFSNGCGKIARIFMNGFLTQGGYPYSVIHCSERQRYYETLRDGNEQLRDLLLDSYDAALDAQFKFLKDIDKRRPKARVTHIN